MLPCIGGVGGGLAAREITQEQKTAICNRSVPPALPLVLLPHHQALSGDLILSVTRGPDDLPPTRAGSETRQDRERWV